MRAYKFLDAEGRAPFTLTPWRPGEWVEASTVQPCREGVHTCRPTDLAYWLSATLWEIDLDDPIVEARHKVTGRRGRLVAQIDGYPVAVEELGAECAWRARDRAVEALRAAGDRTVADRFAAADSLEALAGLGAEVDDATFAGTAAALAADTASFVLSGPISEAPFIGACSAGHLRAGEGAEQEAFDEGYAEERAFQSSWLAARLDLVT